MANFNDYIIFLLAFLIGSIPFGLIVAKLAGVNNLTSQGSGNIGSTNVARVVGKKFGALTLLLDGLKGFLPIYLLLEFPFSSLPANLSQSNIYLTALILVLGHIFSVFLKFKGGKGVATALGTLAALNVYIFLIAIAIWILVFLITKISSLSALASFSLIPFFALFLFEKSSTAQHLAIYCFILTITIFLTHLNNIKRLISGKEKGFKEKKL